MNLDAVKAALLALASQGVALAVGYGLVDNAQAGKWTAVSVGVVNVAFLIAHAWHAQTDANVAVGKQAIRTVKAATARSIAKGSQ